MADITGATVEHSRDCLIRAIHGVDSIPKDLVAHPLSYHIEVNPVNICAVSLLPFELTLDTLTGTDHAIFVDHRPTDRYPQGQHRADRCTAGNWKVQLRGVTARPRREPVAP